MKVLQVNSVYQKGSTGKIVYDVHKCLRDNAIESVVCYGRGDVIKEPNVYKFCSEVESKIYHLLNRFGWLMYAVCPIATRKLIRIIKKERPDIVHLHCINGYCVDIYHLLRFLGRSNIKTIVTHHAEFFYTGSCGHAYDCKKFQKEPGCYRCPILKEATCSSFFDRTNTAWRKMKKAFSYFRRENLRFTAVSPWVVNRSSLSPICNNFECDCVDNGIETDVFHPSAEEAIRKTKHRILHGEQKLILHVAASFTTDKNSIKGGFYIKRLAEAMPTYQFVVVATYLGTIEGLPPNVYVWGRANGQDELASLYSAADVTVIASKRETFSMIVAESLCCGTPVVGFQAGGPESIALKEFSSFVTYGDVESMKIEIERFANMSWDSTMISKEAEATYSKELMTRNYISAYKDMI